MFLYLITEFLLWSILPAGGNYLPRDVTSTSKAGLSWVNGPDVDVKQYLTTRKVSWYYNWDAKAGSIGNEIEYVPMLWGTKNQDEFNATIQQTIQTLGVKAVLGMNEPQEAGQANLTPQQGADIWKAYIEPLKAQGIRLGSPAPSSNPNGKLWLQDWLTACAGGCNPDFIALHWYDINATAFEVYLEDFHNTFQLPLWVTEWACQNYNDVNAQCSMSDVVNLLGETQAFMDAADYVERYAWYGPFENLNGVNPDDGLMTPNGQINALGEQYIGQTKPNPSAAGPDAPAASGGGSSTGAALRIESNALSISLCMVTISLLLSI